MLVTRYLQFVSLIAFFRVIIYFINLEFVTKIKINKKYYNNKQIKELSISYTTLIRLFMLFKGVIFLNSSFLSSKKEQFNYCIISIIFDLFVWIQLIRKYFFIKKKITNEEIFVPPTTAVIIVQSLLVVSFIIFSLFDEED